MKAIILDGSPANDASGERANKIVTTQLIARGWEVKNIRLRETKIGNCAGDFFCWIRKPGICNVADENRDIARAIIHSDLFVYLTPVTFGGYSSTLKRMVDHQIQNISPFFAQIDGETHHQKRYSKYPDFLAVGWMDAPNKQLEAVFSNLTNRNAINFYAKTAVTGVIMTSQTDDEINDLVQDWLNDLKNGKSAMPEKMSENVDEGTKAGKIRRALLLIGSPRTRKSTSQSLGGYLFAKLSERGVQTETIYIHTTMRSKERMVTLLKAVEAADLVTLAFPLYVDSLPSPVIEALERIALDRSCKEISHRQLFAAISNCGFPEAQHNRVALAICETFAKQTGFDWAGSLALGAGQGLVNGTPLAELDGRANSLKRSLEMAAKALADGNRIPRTASDLMAKPVISPWLYRLIGIYGWRQQAKQYGVEKFLKSKPYLDVKA